MGSPQVEGSVWTKTTYRVRKRSSPARPPGFWHLSCGTHSWDPAFLSSTRWLSSPQFRKSKIYFAKDGRFRMKEFRSITTHGSNSMKLSVVQACAHGLGDFVGSLHEHHWSTGRIYSQGHPKDVHRGGTCRGFREPRPRSRNCVVRLYLYNIYIY